MRVLHILDHSLPLQSGYAYRTLGIVKQQRKLGWEPVLLTSGKHYVGGPMRERIGEWEFLRTRRPSGLGSALPVLGEFRIIADLTRRLEEIVQQVAPDILHAHSPVLNALPAIRVGRRHRLPVVYEVRAFWEDAWIGNSGHQASRMRYRATRALETRALRQVDAVITICEGLAGDVIKRGIAAEKVTIVPNAVDPNVFSGHGVADPILMAKLGLEGKTIIGFFGSFYRYEGLHLLLHGLNILKKQHHDIVLLLAGGGPEETKLRDLARELALEDHIVFAGRIAHEEIGRYYDLVDLLVFPRLSMRLTELVTPLKPLEAMAERRVVIASDVGGHRELIRDGETGYLFPPDDPIKLAQTIIRVIAERARWEQIRAAAAAYIASERCWTHSVARYRDVYDRLLRR